MKRYLSALAALVAAPAIAQPAARPAPTVATPRPSSVLAARAEVLIPLLRGETPPDSLFSLSFLRAVPAAEVTRVAAQLRDQYGAVQRVERVESTAAGAGVAFIAYERATVRFNLALEPAPPHRISGLLVAGVEIRGDSLERLAADFRALPGSASFAVARLGDGEPAMLGGLEPERPLAIGSAFKLFILAELARQVGAGERRWSDVVALDRRSFPSGIMQDWPVGAPVTIHSLAALMISRSDNTATDMLLGVVGREHVERLLPALGLRAPERNRPLLSTIELVGLKASPAPVFQAWLAADEAGRRRILAADFARTGPEGMDLGAYGGAPTRIDTIEWFASPADLVRTMDWLRRNGDAETHAILGIAPGVPAAVAAELGYVGYKGGSEPGVISMTYLVRNRAGMWHALSGSWNDPANAVDEGRFALLMQRAVQLVR